MLCPTTASPGDCLSVRKEGKKENNMFRRFRRSTATFEDQQRDVASTAKLVVRPNFTRHTLYHGERPSPPSPSFFAFVSLCSASVVDHRRCLRARLSTQTQDLCLQTGQSIMTLRPSSFLLKNYIISIYSHILFVAATNGST